MKQKSWKVARPVLGGLIIGLLLAVGCFVWYKQFSAYNPGAGFKHVQVTEINSSGFKDVGLKANQPMGVAAGKGMMAVADTQNKRIVILNEEGRITKVVDSLGNKDRLSYPIAVAVHGSIIYTADFYKGQVYLFDVAGKQLGSFPNKRDAVKLGSFSPTALTVDKRGNLYVTDVSRHRVVIFDSTGHVSLTFGQAGTGRGQLQFPNGIAFDEDGDKIYVADSNNSRIQVFDNRGHFVQSLQFPPTVSLQAPRGLLLTPEKKLLILDTLKNQLYSYDLQKGELGIVNLQSGLKFPNSMAYSNQRYVVADRGNNRVISFFIKTGEVKRIED